ncbi:MAG TPA: endonuclease/exonuclease/phosphatase family protein [Rhodothermales bacterium]|nr:endonuclease/exonuclease/phosphatase family protein [Rhodothermales bacterium]
MAIDRRQSQIFLFVEVTMLSAFAAGYLCPYLPPRYFWWTGIAAIGLPFTSLALVLLSVPVLMRRRFVRTETIAHGLALVLIVVRFVHPASWFGGSSPDEEDLIIMTQNLPSAMLERAIPASEKLSGIVERLDPHLIGIQEGIVLGLDTGKYRSTRNAKFRILIDSLGYRMMPLPEDAGGMMPAWYDPVLARIPIQKQRQIEIEYPAEPLQVPLRFVRTEFPWQGRKIVHYNIHLATYGTSKPWRSIHGRPRFSPTTIAAYLSEMKSGFIRRSWEAVEIRALVEREVDPVIVSGDFNCTPNNWAYRHLSSRLQDAWLAAGSGWGATYYSGFPLWRIDFVLISRELETVTADVIRVPTGVSDHRALVVRLRWRQTHAAP